MIKGIDEAVCINCRLCENLCTMDIFRYEDGKVYIAYQDDCCSCMQCKRFCPVEAIEVHEALPRKYDGGYRWKKVKEMLPEL